MMAEAPCQPPFGASLPLTNRPRIRSNRSQPAFYEQLSRARRDEPPSHGSRRRTAIEWSAYERPPDA